MEILFENSYVRDKQMAKEIYKYFYFQSKLFVVCSILLLLCFLCNIVITIFVGTYNWLVYIIVPLFFLLRLYGYFIQVNTMVKRDNEVHGKEITVETIVTNEYIQNTVSTGAVNRLEYDRIKKAVQTKKLILLRSKANLIYIFRKETFTKGNQQEFIKFLIGKGVKMK